MVVGYPLAWDACCLGAEGADDAEVFVFGCPSRFASADGHNQWEALQHRTPYDEPLGYKASLGGRARVVVVSRVLSERYVGLSRCLARGSRPPAAAKPEHWQSALQQLRAVARAVDSCSAKAMKVVIALALPAAALKPVPVTMSAQQGRRNFVIGGARAVQHSRLQKSRGASDAPT